MDLHTEPPTHAFTHRLRARFAETDAMGVVHHASYAAWLEAARVELLRAAGHPYGEVRAAGIDLVVVDLRLHYERPVRFDDDVAVTVWLGAASRAAFELGYVVSVGGERRVTATSRHAAVGLDGRPRRLPRWIEELAAGAAIAHGPGATAAGPDLT
ncbi:MAG: thioesterase family protein [Actinomycetota bacterium]|nr:thioesterase family protein [Actinomycetota bacterium]